MVKRRFSAFHATSLSGQLAARRVTRLVLAGVQTPNCVRAPAFDAIARDIPAVVVLSDATASATPFVQESNLYDLRIAGCDILSTSEWAATLGAVAQVAAAEAVAAPPGADEASGSGAGPSS